MLVILTALITLLFLPQALAPNFASICATRFFQGALGSCEGPVIAGVVADLFPKRTRGMPMAVFVAAVFWGNATGPSVSAWVVRRSSLFLSISVPTSPSSRLSLARTSS